MSRMRTSYFVAGILAAGMSACDIADPFRVLSDDRAVERVVVTPDTVTAAIRDTIELAAKPIGAGDREITEAVIVWSSGDPSLARSLGEGRFVVVARGTAEVFATTRGRRGSARIVVP
ncbi:MAG TPA: hypothetical protein VE869_15500 [Gemmatimonas sp.]|nr:hypothetical protein [Gemmatimonas sp.]